VQPSGLTYRVLCASVIFCILATCADAQTAAIKIVIQEGQGAINNIQQHRAKEPVIQVLLEDGSPVVGASVIFQLPGDGPGAIFADNAKMLSVQTDDKGQAVAHGLRPNQVAGKFQIRVTASFHGQTASAIVSQINAEPAAAKSNTKLIVILALVGGAAAAGAAASLGHKGSGASTPAAAAVTAPPATILLPGNPSITPPH
jgi:hypothetical protein